MNNESFCVIYDKALNEKRWKCTTLYQKLNKAGVHNISIRTLQRYRTGEIVPDFKIAKKLLKLLDYKITDDEIENSLRKSNQHKFYKKNSNYLDFNVRLKISSLSENLTDNAEIIALLKKRIIESQNSDRINMNKYISNLIQKDLDAEVKQKRKK